jgi:aconitate hydratase 2/2-methylisocitrate dehydratase
MIAMGYDDKRTIQRRVDAMQTWLDNPQLLAADKDAEYAQIIEIDLNEITEPLLACPNDPDDIKPLSQVQGVSIDEVFIGSCMTNIGHYRAAGKVLENAGGNVPTRLWIAPPTKMDQHQLVEEGYYSIFGKVGARTEMPGCSLCMGNQARVADGASVVSTSTRNFPNRLGKGANVYLASAELAAVASVLGRLPDVQEYMEAVKHIEPMAADVYRYLNFNEMEDYQQVADSVFPVKISAG